MKWSCALLSYVDEHERQKKKGPAFPPIPDIHIIFGYGLFSGFRHWYDRNECAVFQAFVELNVTFNRGKDCVILAHADILTRPKFRAALTHNDVTWDDKFATIFLYAKTATS